MLEELAIEGRNPITRSFFPENSDGGERSINKQTKRQQTDGAKHIAAEH